VLAAVLMAVIGAGVTLLNYSLFASNESVFWTIFALSSVVFLLPYLLMFPALLVLRRTHSERPRPYRVPGGRFGAGLAVALCETTVAVALGLFFYAVPEGTPHGLYWFVTVGGSAACVAIGLWFASARRVEKREEAAG
jgi:amino acid transporter